MTKPYKPLGGPVFGKIGHLPGSKTGPSDSHISENEMTFYTEGRKNAKDIIIVTEKMDGACVGVYRPIGGYSGNTLVAMQKHGYPVHTSHRAWLAEFDEWVSANRTKFLHILKAGEWLVGEWLVRPHGVKYRLKPSNYFMPFSLRYNPPYSQSSELSYLDMVERIDDAFTLPGVIADDGEPVKIEEVRRYIVRREQSYSIDKPEGAVWRRDGDGFTTRAKWVRPDHVAGMYWEEEDAREDN